MTEHEFHKELVDPELYEFLQYVANAVERQDSGAQKCRYGCDLICLALFGRIPWYIHQPDCIANRAKTLLRYVAADQHRPLARRERRQALFVGSVSIIGFHLFAIATLSIVDPFIMNLLGPTITLDALLIAILSLLGDRYGYLIGRRKRADRGCYSGERTGGNQDGDPCDDPPGDGAGSGRPGATIEGA